MHGSPVRHITTRRPGDNPIARKSFPSSSLRFESAMTPVCPVLSAHNAMDGGFGAEGETPGPGSVPTKARSAA